MDIFQCPECDLKFRYSSELKEHLASDHPEFHVDPKSLEDDLLSAAYRHRHAPHYHPDDER